ncbi:apoptosis regulator Bcl-2-like [Pempheris klunzingeri]|uniref:apoptosis regulator Bcl-2-like n=1 Tax=Pempheris klunzingeri TaxID=3127111 RepID=UPI0039817551
MATSRDIVEDFLRYKLRHSGASAAICATPLRSGGQRRRNAAASISSSSSERVMTSRGVTPEHSQPEPCSAPPCLQDVLRRAGDELARCYHGDLSAQVSVLLLSDGDGAERRRGLTAVREELFRDGVNWGRIVAMMELGGAVCSQVVHRGGAWQVDDITAWLEESLDSPLLRGWIEDNGGWGAFVQLYGASGPPARSWSWSLRTVVGLAALGALGLTLGALHFL